MALRFTLKKKDEDNDERTVPADDFISLALSLHRDIDKLKDIPNTEIPHNPKTPKPQNLITS